MITYDPVFNDIVFKGRNHLTGTPVQVVFNQPRRGASKLLMWNNLLDKWMFSNDAGLRWQPIEENGPIPFTKIMENVDLILKWKGE